MKPFMRQYCTAMLSVLCCAQFSEEKTSVTGREKPPINFRGTLDGKNIENILVAGRYKGIEVYEAPTKKNGDPRKHTARLDLAEIDQIRLVPKTPETPNKKEKYINIIVTLNDPNKTEKTYLIEPYRKIHYDEITEAGPIEHDLAVEALGTLKITGYVEKKEQETEKKERAVKKNNRATHRKEE